MLRSPWTWHQTVCAALRQALEQPDRELALLCNRLVFQYRLFVNTLALFAVVMAVCAGMLVYDGLYCLALLVGVMASVNVVPVVMLRQQTVLAKQVVWAWERKRMLLMERMR